MATGKYWTVFANMVPALVSLLSGSTPGTGVAIGMGGRDRVHRIDDGQSAFI
jgi:hypothetical protein